MCHTIGINLPNGQNTMAKTPIIDAGRLMIIAREIPINMIS